MKSGDRPLIVWTRETGILDVAEELKRWPTIWNAARGKVVARTSRDGARMGWRSAVIFSLRIGNTVASHAMRIQSDDTKANCTSVRVAGILKALRIDFDDVFVSADDVYQSRHRICEKVSLLANQFYLKYFAHTTSFGEMGAFNASAISWAFWLKLPLRVRIVRIASLRLFCLP